MKLLIASDIHGSYFYCKKLIDIYKKDNFDKIILLGDILYHGPRNDLPKEYNPKKVIPLLNELSSQIIAVRGNCDAEVDQMVLDFDILCDNAKLFIDNRLFILSHGHKEFPKSSKNDVILSGHTHIPLHETFENGAHHFNPGSISLAKGNYNNSYMIYENNKFIIYDFLGNIILEKTI